MAIGECSAYSSLQADSKADCSLAYKSRPPSADRLSSDDPKWTLAYGWRRI